VQLVLSKLGDPSQSRGNRNLTLATLVEEIATVNQSELTMQLQSLLAVFHSNSSAIRDRRNKRIAHLDYETSLQRANPPLPGPSRKEIEEVLAALREFMNAIAAHFGDTQIYYQASAPDAAADALLFVLKCGVRYREAGNDDGRWLEDLQKSPYFSV
jgi:hypothetical protein